MVDLSQQKAQQRRRGYDARNAKPNKNGASRAAIERLESIEAYQLASCVLWYLDCRSELRTQWYLPTAIREKRVAIPFCTEEDGQPALGLWAIHDLNELVVGKWNILEPAKERWHEPTRHLNPTDLDLVVVPGVSFSRHGARLGNGQGYYDRLLAKVRADCVLIGLCFECQLFDDLIAEPRDIAMDIIVTEERLYAPTSEPR